MTPLDSIYLFFLSLTLLVVLISSISHNTRTLQSVDAAIITSTITSSLWSDCSVQSEYNLKLS